VVPLAFVIMSVGIAAASFRHAPGPSLAGVALVAVGGVAFRLRGLRRAVIALIVRRDSRPRAPREV
jgi:hypothetical protein